MVDTILMYTELVLECVAFAFALRYHLHMLQLNGYKNNEHIAWMRKHLGHTFPQVMLNIGLVLGVVLILCGAFPVVNSSSFPMRVLDLLILVWEILTIDVFFQKIRQPAKKHFVYTARVKRLIVTDVVLAILVETAVLVLTRDRFVYIGVCVLFAASQFFLPLITNIINRPIEKAVNRHYINDAKRMLSEMPNLTVIGVTGSYGKTSVKFYLETLLRDVFEVLVTPESYNTPMGVVRTIRERLKPIHEIFICEMGARYVGDIKELCDIVHPTHGIITAVGPQHLETFGDITHVRDTKFELADALPSGGKLFLNADNDEILSKLDEYEESAVLYHTCEMDVGYRAKDICVTNLGTEFTVETDDGESERFAMQLVGEHNVINVLGAIAVARELGIPLQRLKVPVRRLAPVRHRMELIDKGTVTLIDDAYNSNPIGSRAAVQTLALFDGLHILVTPGMVELGAEEEAYNRKFGGYAAQCCDYILLVGSHAEPVREGALAEGFPEDRCITFSRVEEAIAYAYQIADTRHKYILLENDLPDHYEIGK